MYITMGVVKPPKKEGKERKEKKRNKSAGPTRVDLNLLSKVYKRIIRGENNEVPDKCMWLSFQQETNGETSACTTWPVCTLDTCTFVH